MGKSDPASTPAATDPVTPAAPPSSSTPPPSTPTDPPAAKPSEAAKSDFAPITSQDDLDHIVFNRLKQQESTLRKTITDEVAAALKAEAEQATKQEQGKYEDLWKTAQEKVDALTGQLAELTTKSIRSTVAAKYNIPPDLIDRIVGDDQAAMEADAKRFAAFLKEPSVDNDAGKRTRSNGGAGPAKVVPPTFKLPRPQVPRPGYEREKDGG